MSVDLWVEKYRPKTFDEYVWRDSAMRAKFEEMVRDRATPHLLLEGTAGTGKTSLAYLVLSRIGIPKGDILYINATRERKIEDIQAKIIGFVGTWALNDTGIKYIILDEADAMSPLAQRLLRGEMETYHRECRFILTCNYAAKIIPALHSRCQTFTFRTLDRADFTARVAEVLEREEVDWQLPGLEVIEKYVQASFPDLRKCINLIQQGTRIKGIIFDGKSEHDKGRLRYLDFLADLSGVAETKDYLVEMTNLFRTGRTNEARKLIIAQAQAEEYIDIYRYLYRNLDIWGDSEDIQDHALLAIRKGMIQHTMAADPEINLSACMVELKMIANGTL